MRANAGKAASSSCLLDHREAFDAGVDEEAFEPGDACLCQRCQVPGVQASQSAPRRPIDTALAGSGVTFGFECSHGCGFGKTIERHIHQRGVSTGGCGAGGGGEAFPLRPAWFVDVNMRIHQAG